jgi:DNA polymerase-3 subunit gamma/tau
VPLSVDDATLVVALDNPGVVTAVRASGREEALRQAVRDVLRVDRKIEVILDPGRSAPVPSAASATSTPPAAPAPADAPAAAPADDVPSPDDADLDGDGVSGEDLIMRSLGGQRIGEIG